MSTKSCGVLLKTMVLLTRFEFFLGQAGCQPNESSRDEKSYFRTL